MRLFAGAGSGTIRFPETLFPLEGFRGVHDAPRVRVLAVDCAEKAALVSVELVMLPPELVEMVQTIVSDHTGVKKENIWVHTTHAITTPHAPHAPIGPGGVPLEIREEDKKDLERKIGLYREALAAAVTEAAKQTAQTVRPALLGLGRCESHISINRDVQTPFGWWIGQNPEGKTDPAVTILRFDGEDGRPIAALLTCGLKPCVIDNSWMGEGKRLVSADAPGLACRLLEAELGAPCLFFMGAAGDQVPREQALLDEVLEDGTVRTVDLGVEEGLRMVDRLGRQMAADVLPTVKGIHGGTATAPISLDKTAIVWGGKGRIRMQPRRTVEFRQEREVTVDGNVLTIGDIALVGLKPEINCVTGEQLRQASPYAVTLVISMVNGGQKYMPDAAAYENITWEAQNSMLMPGAAEAWVEAVAAKLREMKGEMHNAGNQE